MAISNRDRVGKALDQLRDGLLPYISTELYTNVGTNWQDQLPPQSKNLQDVTVLLNLFMDHWQGVFKKKLSQSDRAYVSELKEARNKWAHSEPISSDDADRYLDTAARLCGNRRPWCSAPIPSASRCLAMPRCRGPGPISSSGCNSAWWTTWRRVGGDRRCHPRQAGLAPGDHPGPGPAPAGGVDRLVAVYPPAQLPGMECPPPGAGAGDPGDGCHLDRFLIPPERGAVPARGVNPEEHHPRRRGQRRPSEIRSRPGSRRGDGRSERAGPAAAAPADPRWCWRHLVGWPGCCRGPGLASGRGLTAGLDVVVVGACQGGAADRAEQQAVAGGLVPKYLVERIEALLRGSPLPARRAEREQVRGRLVRAR